ncbi:MAG: hypothetical protein EOM59_19510 [Clostridia bacterium]|jgi:hypothetical protein|nr:hypothetical protein [Clostridia bacterium]
MKSKGIVVLFLIFCSVSCDNSEQFVIDGKHEYALSDECGIIKIKGSSFATLVIIGCTFNGKYQVNTDSLKIEAISSEDVITNIHFRLNNEDFVGKEIETKGGETLTLYFNLKSSESYQSSSGTVLLLPSNFIICENKPIIADTIQIQLKK